MFATNAPKKSGDVEGRRRRPSLPLAALQRFRRGLHLTGLAEDIVGGGHTLIAPIDAAFDALPWPFERLLEEDALVEPRFDLFEYLVVPEACAGDGPPRNFSTLQGERIRIGGRFVHGRHGVGRILATVTLDRLLVHVVDSCVLPSSILAYEVEACRD